MNTKKYNSKETRPKNKTKKTKKVRLNEKIIEMLHKLSKLMKSKGEHIKVLAYTKAMDSVVQTKEDIKKVEELRGKPNIGDSIIKKCEIYIKTGTLPIFEEEKSNPVNIFTGVHGIGPKKAEELVNKHNIQTIDELKTHPELLNDTQKKGLQYYEHIIKRIPRKEIDAYKQVFDNILNKLDVNEFTYEIVGSYRRGAKDSGDIDVILSGKNSEIFEKLIEQLSNQKILLEILSKGQTKCLGIAKLPKYRTARRVDFLFATEVEYPFSILYFTGSQTFNTAMRGYALKMGMSLNEHGLYKKISGIKEEKLDLNIKEEKDIFKALHLEYKTPIERIDGNSVVSTIPTIKSQEEPEDADCYSSCDVVPAGKCATDCEPSWTDDKHKKSRNWCSCNVDKQSCGIHICKDKIAPVKVKKTRKQNPVKTNKRITIKKIQMKEKVEEPVIEKVEEPVIEKIEEPVIEKIEENKLVLEEEMKTRSLVVKEKVELFKIKGIEVLTQCTEKELIQMLQEANKYYYNDEPLMNDNTYDILKEYIEHTYPTNEMVKDIGAEVTKNKVTLPYFMGSMDKIKPDTKALGSWLKQYKGGYVLSCKLDGISGLYSTEEEEAKLYTRGNGKVGQDISYLIPYLNLPTEKGVVVRGELIMLKDTFQKKYASTFANARNMVSGLINSKKIDNKIKDIHFVAYEVIKPELNIMDQMKLLETNKFKVVEYESTNKLSNEILSTKLVDWRNNYKYEMDGVIVADNNMHERKEKNPEYAFAFKMVISDQVAEAKVIDVIWTPSKSGYLKPKVRIEPVRLGGVKIEYATGFNGSFIENNKVGIGAKIMLIRSGDVIPHIKEVIEQAEEAKMPNVAYHWNESHVDIVLDNMEENDVVKEKNITAFFTTLGVEGLSTGNVKRIMKTGYNSIAKILLMKKVEFEKVEGFKEKMVEKVYSGIQEKVTKASLVDIMIASNMFGRGIGKRKIQPIMDMYPDILISKESFEEKIMLLKQVPNIGKENANSFVSNINVFMKFLKEAELEYKLEEKEQKEQKEEKEENTIVADHVLTGKNVVMTKVRDKEIQIKLGEVGGHLVDTINKHTFVLIVKNKEDVSNKTKKALELGVAIMDVDEFKKKYM